MQLDRIICTSKQVGRNLFQNWRRRGSEPGVVVFVTKKWFCSRIVHRFLLPVFYAFPSCVSVSHVAPLGVSLALVPCFVVDMPSWYCSRAREFCLVLIGRCPQPTKSLQEPCSWYKPNFSGRMLRICLAASGEEVVALDAREIQAVVEERGSTVASLKHYLAQRHFTKRFSRFQLRILREGDSKEMEDEESITPPLDLQLVFLNHLPPDEARDALFVRRCGSGLVNEAEERLKALQNPNVACGGETALTCAAARGRQEVVRLLLEAGADTEWRDNPRSYTALHVAARIGAMEVARRLLESHADMEAVDSEGRRPLHLASLEGNARVAQLLLHAGADKEAGNRDGQRPLHIASALGHFLVARVLLQAGVEKNAVDGHGMTAAKLARQKGHMRIEQLIFFEQCCCCVQPSMLQQSIFQLVRDELVG